MVSEAKIKEAFGKVKDDIEGVKNELAFALKRIAKIEDTLNKEAIEKIVEISAKRNKRSRKRK